jgi:hypothetical protein
LPFGNAVDESGGAPSNGVAALAVAAFDADVRVGMARPIGDRPAVATPPVTTLVFVPGDVGVATPDLMNSSCRSLG